VRGHSAETFDHNRETWQVPKARSWRTKTGRLSLTAYLNLPRNNSVRGGRIRDSPELANAHWQICCDKTRQRPASFFNSSGDHRPGGRIGGVSRTDWVVTSGDAVLSSTTTRNFHVQEFREGEIGFTFTQGAVTEAGIDALR